MARVARGVVAAVGAVLCLARLHLWGETMPPTAFSVATYNCLMLVEAGRVADPDREISDCLLCVQGTRRRQQVGRHYQLERGPDRRLWVHWGYGGRFSNKSCGVSIRLASPWRLSHIVEFRHPPQELSGRGGFLRLRHGACDVGVLVLYYPCVGTPCYVDIVEKLTGWVRDLLHRLPARCMLVGGADLNSQVDGMMLDAGGGVVGPFHSGSVRASGTALSHALLVHGGHFPDTYVRLGPSYYGPRGATSSIDHLILDNSLRESVMEVKLNHRAARRLQVIPHPDHRDHLPMSMRIRWPAWGRAPSPPNVSVDRGDVGL